MDLSDVQGLVFHSYRRLPHASYVLLRFGQRAAARRWLADFVDGHRIDSALPKQVGPSGSPEVRVNVALTYSGLVALGVDQDALATFPLEFIEGLGVPWPDGCQPDHRSRALGDIGTSQPANWNWGYQDERRTVDALLLAYAKDPVVLELQVAGWIKQGEACSALAPGGTTTLWGRFPDDPAEPNREPFGFVDGISQPVLKRASNHLRRNAHPRQPASQEIEDGELLLGHRDGSRQVSRSPSVRATCDPSGVLPVAHEDCDRHDLGFNGTYLVFRQLAQDVDGFSRACRDAAAALRLTEDHVGALVVGRWKDGSPLISAPVAHDPGLATAPAANDFLYRHDPDGERCPMGAHIRRANPRDSLDGDPVSSLAVVNRHRILRRGRPYVAGSGDRGLHFIALNASISRQFEFIQQNWMNDSAFNGLCGEDDPLLGARQGAASTGSHSIPPPPEDRIPRRISGLERYVTVRGGGYFFLPSLAALRYLSQPDPVPRERAQPAATAARHAPWRPAPAAPTAADRIRSLVLARFSILSAVLLIIAPLGILSPATAPIVRPAFDLDRPWEMGIVACLASLAAAGALLTFRVVRLYAGRRFNLNARALPLTWGVVFTWQLLSLPIVASALWRSASDAAIEWGSWRSSGWRFAAAAIAGYASAFLVLYVASAARAASVRHDNPEDAVLLPLTRRLARIKRQPSVVERLTAPVVNFFESRAALLSESVGIGYVDHSTGRLLPGHLTAAIFAVVLGALYVPGWWWLRPPTAFQLPPLAYFLFLALAAGLAAACAAFFFDRFRLPLLTIVLAWFVVATVVGGTDHEFAVVQDTTLLEPLRVTDVLGRADAFYSRRDDTDSSGRPVVIVAAGGGGIRQAVWTSRVLAGLTNLWGPRFSENLRLVSAVSAGGVGALPFLNEYTRERSPSGDLRQLVRASEASASGDIWWGLTYADSLRALFPFPSERFLPRTMDRGWALERAWQRSLGFGSSAPTLGMWRADVAGGWRPAVAFNATVVETGNRAVLATYRLPERAAAASDARPGIAPSRGQAPVDVEGVTGHLDLSVMTAARLSAAFPYVTPVARPGGTTDKQSMFHLADGGYWDNSGMVSVLEWLADGADALAHRDVLVIQIAPALLGPPVIHDRAWVWQLTAPLAGLLSVRTAAQEARNALAVELFGAGWRGKRIKFVTLTDRDREEAGQPEPEASLGWHLSRRESCDVEKIWRVKYEENNRPELADIESILGRRNTVTTEPRRGCQP